MAMQNQTGPEKGHWDGVLGTEEFPIENDRYHLYVGWFCPFAHRVLLTRELKGLQGFISIDIVRPYPKPWIFPKDREEYPGSTPDSLFHSHKLSEVYQRDTPDYEGKFSVPLLWDKRANKIVNNESEDIMRQLNTVFNDLLPPSSPRRSYHFYPEDLRNRIDDINQKLVPNLNLGVYKAGFAQNQETYDANVEIVFETLRWLSDILTSHSNMPYLCGQRLTEVDLKLYATLIRFDTIYVQHFKCNIGTIRHDFPTLHRYLKHLYWKVPGFKETTNFKHIKENYSKSHGDINPKAITPKGPIPNIEPWTDRDEEWYQALKVGFDTGS